MLHRNMVEHRTSTYMYIIVIAWSYVALMMTVAEATNPSGTVLGAIITFVLYGVVPVSLVIYLLGRPVRRRAREAREAAEAQSPGSAAPDASSEAAAGPVAPVRKEP
jgi:hypothetical protein